jgi:hypothetical protein
MPFPSHLKSTFETDDGKESIVWIYEISGGSAPRRLTLRI